MKQVIVLGTGCPSCKKTFELINNIVKTNEFDANVTKNEDISELLKYGVMTTPAVVIDDKIVFVGGVPSEKEIIEWFSEHTSFNCSCCCK